MPASGTEDSVGFQLWVNLSKDLKFCEPVYQEYKKETIPVVEKDGIEIKLISGEAFDVSPSNIVKQYSYLICCK